MTHLLDTNACIAHLRSPHSGVTRELRKRGPGTVTLCSIVKAEPLFGAKRSQEQKRNLQTLTTFFAGFVSLPFDDDAALAYSGARASLTAAGTPIGPNDMLIASIALANHLVLVTHNVAELRRVPGLQIEDWEALP